MRLRRTYITKNKIDKIIEVTGGNLIKLERIANDKTAAAEIRFTAFAALDKKYSAFPEQKRYHKPERENHRLVGYRKNDLG